MVEPVRCYLCKRWFPTRHNLEAHEWIEHMTEQERAEFTKKLKGKPLAPEDEVFKGFKEGDE